MNLQPPVKTRKLQEALHAKAKEAPGYRFYLLYDKVYREDVLAHAYRAAARRVARRVWTASASRTSSRPGWNDG